MNEKDKLCRCNDSRRCFAKQYSGTCCSILIPTYHGDSGYADGECPFCKPICRVTDGVVYPYNPYYL